MVKWSKRDAVLPGGQVLFVMPSSGARWWWSVSESNASDNEAEGYAPTKKQAMACAVAVATALGWLKAEEKPERVLVAEWWECHRHKGVGGGHFREGSLSGARLTMAEHASVVRIVHVRRYKR